MSRSLAPHRLSKVVPLRFRRSAPRRSTRYSRASESCCSGGPDWINADVLSRILGALSSAKRDRDEGIVFRESVATVVRSQQIVSLMGLAGKRGDVDDMLVLFAKLDGRSWASTGTNVYPSNQISHAFMTAMDARAEAGSLSDVARLVDGYLDASRRRSQAGLRRSRPGPGPGKPDRIARSSSSGIIAARSRWNSPRRATSLIAMSS